LTRLPTSKQTKYGTDAAMSLENANPAEAFFSFSDLRPLPVSRR
jgi:hypothetical protein